MPFDLIIRDAKVVSPHSVSPADVAVQDGRIVEVGSVSGSGREEVDAAGLHLMPGVIDSQVHFREPGATHKEDLESGTRAAICGGVTTVFEMPNTNPATVSEEALQDKLRRAKGRAWCDHAFFIGATAGNVDRLLELELLPGTPGVKIFVGSSTGSLLVEGDELLLRVFQNGSHRCALHSEHEPRLRERALLSAEPAQVGDHPFLRDAEAAVESTKRILRLAEAASRPVHILHISTADEVPILANAKRLGQPVSAEVTPQHLYFEAPSCYDRLGTLAQMNPPIREGYHRRGLWAGLEAGVFDCFGSDHAPHTLAEKSAPYRGKPEGSPSGMPGVQTLLPVVLEFCRRGLLSLGTLVQMACVGPSQLYGLEGKGAIERGFDADFVLFDPTATHVLSRWDCESKCGWSPFEGERIGAFPTAVYLRGKLAAKNGRAVGAPSGEPARFAWKETSAKRTS